MGWIFKAIVVSVLVFGAGLALAGDWHTYHGDFELTGVSSDGFPAKPTRLWRTKVGIDLSSPIVGGDGGLFCVADEATVTALDASGVTRWTRAWPTTNETGVAQNRDFVAPPLYVHRELLVVASIDGSVYGLSPTDGTQKWAYTADGRIQGTPNYVAGEKGQPGKVLVITQDEGTIHGLSADDGRKLWTSEPTERTDGHMAVSDGIAVFGNCASALFAVNVASGGDVSTVPVGEGCEMAGGLAVSGGRVYSGNRSGSLSCVDLKSAAVSWLNEDGDGALDTTPAVTKGFAVFSGGDGALYGIDPESGKSQWSFDASGMDPLSPVIAGDGVVAVVDGTLYGLALQDGTLRWRLPVSDEITSPSIIDGMIVVGTDDGYVAAYGSAK